MVYIITTSDSVILSSEPEDSPEFESNSVELPSNYPPGLASTLRNILFKADAPVTLY